MKKMISCNKFHHLFLFLILSLSIVSGCGTPSAKKPSSSGTASTQKEGGHLWDYKKDYLNLYSVQDDIKLGEQVMEAQIKEMKKSGAGVDLPKHSELKGRIEQIVNKIGRNSDMPSFPYEVHIFDRPDIVNAFSLPGGKMAVFTGLFDKEKGLVDINNDDQIAAVLGHEIAHATMRHVTRRVSSLQGWGFLGSVASVAIGAGAGSSARQVFNNVFSLGANLYLPSYSRKFEKQADQIGFYYMSKAGYNPQAAVTIWEKAAAKGGRNSKKTDFFASHPASGERAETLKKWLPEALDIYQGKAPQ